MARFDLYKGREYWWWYYFLVLAASKHDPQLNVFMKQLIYDAIDYEDDYDSKKRKGLVDKYKW